jgi:hypothetical protein
MKMSSIKEQFQEEVREYLDRLTDRIVPVLKQLVEYSYVPAVKSLDFEVFCDSFAYAFPVRAFFMDEDNSEYFIYVDGKAQYPCPVDPGLLEIEGVYPAELEEMYFQQDEDLDIFTIAGETLIDWFAECWKEAGGLSFPLQAHIALHDDVRAFDLVNQKWQPC